MKFFIDVGKRKNETEMPLKLKRDCYSEYCAGLNYANRWRIFPIISHRVEWRSKNGQEIEYQTTKMLCEHWQNAAEIRALDNWRNSSIFGKTPHPPPPRYIQLPIHSLCPTTYSLV